MHRHQCHHRARAVFVVGMIGALVACETSPRESLDHVPDVRITSIAPGEILYPVQEQWEFIGLATDPDEYSNASLAVRFTLTGLDEEIFSDWPTPDENGQVALRPSFVPTGDYLLTLQATDTSNRTTVHALQFSVKNAVPEVSFLEPSPQSLLDEGRTIAVRVQILDADNPSTKGFSATLRDNFSGVIESVLTEPDGIANFDYTPLVPGDVVLSVDAIDELDGKSTASLEVTVRPCGDADADGYMSCETDADAADCDDADPQIFPSADEQCDGRDSNCDGEVPEDELDRDADGVAVCAGDCEDNAAETGPGFDELCDGQDNNCDGVVPDNEFDRDEDGFIGCSTDGSFADCDDTLSAVFPGAVEICDGYDTDCDGAILAEETDRDNDGFFPCSGDCNDSDAYTFPNAIERLDLRDNNCDGAIEGDVVLSAANVRYEGTSADSLVGWSLSATDDIDGNDVADLAIGAPQFSVTGGTSSYKGAVFLVFGKEDGWTSKPTSTTSELVGIFGTESSAFLGKSVGMVRDLNGDSLADLVIGAPGHTSASYADAGEVWVLPGRHDWSSEDVTTSPLTRIEGTATQMELGSAVSNANDINNDGLMDIALGAPWRERRPSPTGLIAVLSERPLGWSTSTALNSLARISGSDSYAIGTSLSLGSANGDGYIDIVAGGLLDPETQEGMALWIPGGTSIRQGTQTTVDNLNGRTYVGDNSGELIGYSVSATGDLNGDGFDDMLVGRSAAGALGEPLGYLVFGAASLPASSGIDGAASVRFISSEDELCPCAVVGLPDWNGDGIGDIAISTSNADINGSSSGAVYLVLGHEGSWPSSMDLRDAAGVLLGESAGDMAGYSLASGDLNGDGIYDLLVGAPYASVRSTNNQIHSRSGKVYVIFGTRT